MTEPTREALLDTYHRLYAAYGPQGWWPGGSRFEVVVGAILTQAAAWTNVEKAFARMLFERHGGDLDRLFALPLPELRRELLVTHGVGPETADAVILYAAGQPCFLLAAYTRRVSG